MRNRLLILGIIMCLVGIVFGFTASRLRPPFKVDKTFLEQHTPTSVNGYEFVPSQQDPGESYVVDDATMKMLDPFGIVSRAYKKGDSLFDVLLVASDKRESFHDPNVCLPSQGLIVEDEHEEDIETKTRGKVHLTIAKLIAPDHSTSSWIAYFYKVQDKFIARGKASIFVLTLAMFKGPLLHANFDMNTVFYRFISEQPGATKEQFLQFVADFLDTAKEYSHGYF